MTRTRRRPTALLTLAALLGGLAWTAAAPAEPAYAAARVSIANEQGNAQADTTYSTQITVTGSGFQSVPGAFGGVYVAFGTVGSGWQPSKGGVSGVDFRYVPDSESQDNAGFQRYVAFPGSSTAGEAHATMSDSGGWSVTLTVPGPTFETSGRSGGTETVDCRRVTCGVITFGAHGVINANNETFTPVEFTDVFGEGGAGGAEQGEDEGAADDEATDDEAAGTTEEAQQAAEPVLEVDRTTAVVGRVMTFTAQGFVPGEQVVGSLGAGLAAVGPLVAGAQGEVAGVLQLPADLRAGTHVLALTGAASATRVEEQLQVAAAPAALASTTSSAAATAAGSAEVTGPAWEWVALGVAALVLFVVIGIGIVTAVRERRARNRTAAVAR